MMILLNVMAEKKNSKIGGGLLLSHIKGWILLTSKINLEETKEDS